MGAPTYPPPTGWPTGLTLKSTGGPCLSPASWAALRGDLRRHDSMWLTWVNMVLGPFPNEQNLLRETFLERGRPARHWNAPVGTSNAITKKGEHRQLHTN